MPGDRGVLEKPKTAAVVRTRVLEMSYQDGHLLAIADSKRNAKSYDLHEYGEIHKTLREAHPLNLRKSISYGNREHIDDS